MALPDYSRDVYGPVQFGSLSIVVIQATMVAGDVVRDAAASSPDTTIVLNTTGQFTITFPGGQFYHLVGAEVQLAEAAGSKLYQESVTVATGSATFEAAVTPGTAATPADNSRLYITFLLGQN